MLRGFELLRKCSVINAVYIKHQWNLGAKCRVILSRSKKILFLGQVEFLLEQSSF
jgi:hypothetical protein